MCFVLLKQLINLVNLHLNYPLFYACEFSKFSTFGQQCFQNWNDYRYLQDIAFMQNQSVFRNIAYHII